MSVEKFHRYDSVENLDSIRAEMKRFFLDDYRHAESAIDDNDYEYDEVQSETISFLDSGSGLPKGLKPSRWHEAMRQKKPVYQIISENETYDEATQTRTFNAVVSRDKSTQAVKYRALFRPDAKIILSTLIARDYKNDDPFIEKTIQSVSMDGAAEKSVFDDKFALFLEDAQNEDDTIRYSAMQSVYSVEISKKHYDALEEFLASFEFRSDEESAASTLFDHLVRMDSKRAIPFLENYYRREGLAASQQLDILSAIAEAKSKKAYLSIVTLMEEDLPIPDAAYEVNMLFSQFEGDARESKALFPEILQFYSTEEYRMPVINLYNHLADEELISGRAIKSLRKSILINANSEYKRVANRKKKLDRGEEVIEVGDTQIEELVAYINLLYPFEKEKKIAVFLSKCRALNVSSLNQEFLRLDVVKGKSDKEVLAKALQDRSQKFLAIQLMSGKNDKSFYEILTDDEIALAAMQSLSDAKSTTIEQLHKETVALNGKSVTFYFFETVTGNTYDDTTDKRLRTVAFVNDGARIDAGAYHFGHSISEVAEDKRAAKYKSIINQTLYGWHERANFEKIDRESQFANYMNEF